MHHPSTLPTIVHRQARVYGDRTAILYKDEEAGKWRDISWNGFSEKVSLVSKALMSLGVDIQENLAVFSQNMPECLFVDFGAYAIRAVTIPFYATSSEMQVKYMVSDAKIRTIFVGEQYQYDTAYRILKIEASVQRLVIFDRSVKKNPQDQVSLYFDEFLALGKDESHNEEIKTRIEEQDQDDIANILYTSGTTGLSKGVMVTHRMYNAALRAHEGVLPLTDSDVVMNFLPYTHIFERGWTCLCIKNGCTLAVNRNPADILKSLREVHPTCMCAVPRFWEKVYAGVLEKIDKASPLQKRMMIDALHVGKMYNVQYKMRGLEPPMGLKMQYLFYEKTVISFMLKTLGLERHHFFPTAGAAIPPKVEEFVHSAGIMMIAGYGLTESTATVSCDRYDKPVTVGSIGRILPGVQVKFGENNEILLKGDTITKGYYRKAEVTALAIDSQGWFHTGDAGYMKDDELYITDRIKDLFKTSNGKYIAPQMLESKLCVDKYVDQVVIIADRKKFVSALVIPEYKLLAEWAKAHGIECADRRDLCANEEVNAFVMDRLETMQQDLAHYEQVKRITLLPEPLSLERGELTDTLKVKRAVLNENYKAQIEAMYHEQDFSSCL